jgi:hypothetical protein
MSFYALNNVMRELDAIIIIINVVAIQNGPYKSVFFPTMFLNAGRKVTADLIRSKISYSYISKYSLCIFYQK